MNTWEQQLRATGVAFVLFGSSVAVAQPGLEWQRCFGGTGAESGLSIEQVSDGGFIVAGYTSSLDGDVSGHHGGWPGEPAWDIWVLRLDAAGALVWQRCFGGTSQDGLDAGQAGLNAVSVKGTLDGGFIVAGCTRSNDGDVDGNHGSSDAWVLKLDNGGDLQWQRCLGGVQYDYAEEIHQLADGGYILAGHTASNSGDVSGNHGGIDYWVVRLDETGAIEWQRCLGGPGSDLSRSIYPTADGGFVLTGYAQTNGGDVTDNLGWDVWSVKLDGVGAIEWERCVGGTNWDGGFSTVPTLDGGFILAGYTSSYDGDVVGNHGYQDAWVVKLDEAGSLEWQRCLGGDSGIGNDRAYSIQQVQNDGYVLAGWTMSNNGDVSGNHGGQDAWLVKLDITGSLQWQKCLGGVGSESAECVRPTMDGGLVIVGSTSSSDGDVSGNHGGATDLWVAKLAPGVGMDEARITLFSLVPNPANENVTLSFKPNTLPRSVRVYDAVGNEVLRHAVSGNINSMELDMTSLESGLYCVQVDYANGTSVLEKVVKE